MKNIINIMTQQLTLFL